MSSCFNPSNLELVRDHLRSKVEKGHHGFITEMDIYQEEPWLLQHVNPHPLFREREWFYFVPKRGVMFERKVPGRIGESEGGTWRSILGMARIHEKEEEGGNIIGYMRSFVYIKKHDAFQEWLMEEYSLCDDVHVHDWVLCRIRYRPLPVYEDEDVSIMSMVEEEDHGEQHG